MTMPNGKTDKFEIIFPLLIVGLVILAFSSVLPMLGHAQALNANPTLITTTECSGGGAYRGAVLVNDSDGKLHMQFNLIGAKPNQVYDLWLAVDRPNPDHASPTETIEQILQSLIYLGRVTTNGAGWVQSQEFIKTADDLGSGVHTGHFFAFSWEITSGSQPTPSSICDNYTEHVHNVLPLNLSFTLVSAPVGGHPAYGPPAFIDIPDPSTQCTISNLIYLDTRVFTVNKNSQIFFCMFSNAGDDRQNTVQVIALDITSASWQSSPGFYSFGKFIWTTPGYPSSWYVRFLTHCINIPCPDSTQVKAIFNVVDPSPIANAGTDRGADEGKLVTLYGAGSSDPQGDQLSFAWTQLTGPPVTLSNPNMPVATFIAPQVTSSQILRFSLTVSDAFTSSTDTVDVTVNPIPPTIKVLFGNTRQPVITASGKILLPIVNPYLNPVTQVKVTAEKFGQPLKDMNITITTCPEPYYMSRDGHVHDNRKDACDPGRPFGELWESIPPAGQGHNTINLNTGNTGEVTFWHTPPSISIGGKTHYISGIERITATADSVPVGIGKARIILGMPDLLPMEGSGTQVNQGCTGRVTGAKTWEFVKQDNHGCFFYGTKKTIAALKQIADEFWYKQVLCAQIRPDLRCQIISPLTHEPTYVKTLGEPQYLRITAMSLKWGGLLDIGPGNSCPPSKCSFWQPPHSAHENGKVADIGLSNLKNAKGYDIDRILLLRDIIFHNQNFQSFVSNEEGRDVGLTLRQKGPHFHIIFID